MSKQVYHIWVSHVVFLIAFMFLGQAIIAQLPVIKTSVNKNHILIGEQFQYKVETSMSDNSFRLTWFSIPDSFGNFVVVSQNKIDSSVINGNLICSQELTLTSFDSGRVVIPPLTLTA